MGANHAENSFGCGGCYYAGGVFWKVFVIRIDMKKMLFIIIIFIAFICLQCKKVAMDKEYAITLINNSSHSIGYYFAMGGVYGSFYPDTTLPVTNKYVGTELKAGEKFYYGSSVEWEEVFTSHTFPKDTLSVFVFHTDTLKKYSWDEIRNNYKIIKCYDLSMYDLKKYNWTIIYP